jgi:starvation-inducible DNA-binding protein
MIMNNPHHSQEMKANLAMSLGHCLGTTFAFYTKAIGFHWNVKGPDFYQFHDLFGDIYTDARSAVDPIAESILKLGFDSPATLSSMSSFSKIENMDNKSIDDPVLMSADLLEANNILNDCILDSFRLATEANEQGICDLLAARDDMHKKWAWQLRAITGMQAGGKLVATPMQEQVKVEVEVYAYEDGMDDSFGDDDSAYDDFGFLAAASKPAPKKDRIKGSKKNPKGSAAGGRSITFSAKTEKALMNKVKEHNEGAKSGRKTTMAQLKAVYRRGAGAFSSSHRPGKTRDQWAMARVNAYLHLLSAGRPSNPNYKQDNDLLPQAHPKSTASIVASALAADELYIELRPQNEYETTEHAITEFAEYSGLGYEVIPALRAAWKRGVDNNESGFDRARELAVMTYDSEDADLLPQVES